MAFNQLNDRCDKCGAEALTRVENFEGSDLQFCGHHYNRFSAALDEQGFVLVDDNRGKFLSKAEMLMGSEH